MRLEQEVQIYKDGAIQNALDDLETASTMYVWHTATDIGAGAGTHITEIPQEDFLDDPANGGSNLWLSSTGLILRNGLTELSKFEQSAVQVGMTDSGHSIFTDNGMQILVMSANDVLVPIANLGYDIGYDEQGQLQTAPYFTLGLRLSGSDIGNYSLAEGINNEASGSCSHAEGRQNEASGNNSHAEGFWNEASGNNSHVSGFRNKASTDNQTVIGRYNEEDSGTEHPFIIGNGTLNNESNALTVDWNGNVDIAGTLSQGSDKRLKQHIDYLGKDAVDFIQKLKPAVYIKGDSKELGLYAQDVEEAETWGTNIVGEMNGYKTLSYTELIAPLIAYCQKLEERIAELEGKK